MNKYKVTVHPNVRVKVYKIDAVDKKEAADIAREMAIEDCYFGCTEKDASLIKRSFAKGIL